MKGKIIFLGIDVGLAIVVGIFSIICLGFIGLLNGNAFEGIGGEGGGGGGSGGWDCGGTTQIPPECTNCYAYVREAAGVWMGGDEASLIAMIEIESGWRVDAKNSGSTAAGLGQFITSTAKGYKEFTGGKDDKGREWPAGQVYDDPDPKVHPDDARFDAERSIYAAAHKLSFDMKGNNGSLGQAYEESYHGYCKDMSDPKCVKQHAEAEAGRKRLEDTYNDIIKNGGCKQRGTACGVVELSDANATFSSKHRELMPPAASSFNQIAAEYNQKASKKLEVTSTFRTHDEQETLHEQKPNLANEPGQSMHEAGLAIDVNWKAMSDTDYKTFLDIAAANQWEVANHAGRGTAESWHFDYAALKDQYWYGEPKISNAIAAANSCGGSEVTILSIVNKISMNAFYGGKR